MNSINQMGNSFYDNADPLYAPDEKEKKKKKPSAFTPDSLQNTRQPSDVNSLPATKPIDYSAAMADVAGFKSRLNDYKIQPSSNEQVENRLNDTIKGIMLPQDTPERRMQTYSQSDAVIDAVIDDSFGESMKQRLKEKRQKSKQRSESAYRSSMSVLGANPEYGMYRAMEADDALKDIEATISETNIEELYNRVAPLAKHSGYSVEEYVNQRVLPKMYNKLLDDVIAEEKPGSSAEYILRSALNNSLVAKAAQLGRDLKLGNNNHTMLQNEALASYNSGRLENFVSSVGSLMLDAPVFKGLGTVARGLMGGMAKKITNSLATKILSTKMGEGMTRATANKAAERIISNRLGFKIMQSSGTQGLTLGGYDAINSVVDDLLQQNDIETGKAAGAFSKGLLTGGALGLVGTPLREAAKGLTGAKKMFASSGVLSAESAVFTAGTEIEKFKNDIEIEPLDIVKDFGESAATLLVMRMTHWRPNGALFKLGADGKLKKGFSLSNSEKAELRELNVNPEQFLSAIEQELKLPSYGGERSRYIKDTYTSLMTDDKLSAAAKSKLLFLVESKVTSTPPLPFDFTANKRSDGKWEIEIQDAVGRRLSRNVFDHAGNAKSYLMVHAAELRRNRIATYEQELTQSLRSENFLRQAGIFAKKSGTSIEDISTAIFKKSVGREMSNEEQNIIDNILERSSYDEAGMVQMLYNVRRKIEKKYGLEKGTMFIDIHEPFYRLTEAKNRSLDEYEVVLRDEVDRLKNGTEQRRAVRLLKQGMNSDYFGMTNDEVIEREIQDYHDWVAVRDADRVGLFQQSVPRAPVRPINIPPDDNSGYVWSYGAAKNTKEDIALYEKRAQDVANKFRVKLNFIRDEREIERPDPEDTNAVIEYNNQIVSDGWNHNGHVFINLPNAKSVQDVEKTVFHEVVGHRGLMNVFGEYLYDFLEDVYRKASPEVLRGINKIKYRYRSSDNYTVMEEYLAYLAENVNTTRAERTVYGKIKDYVKSLLIRMNIYTGSNRSISEAELTRIMKRHADYMQKGTAPEEYIKDAFGSFKSAHHDAEAYHNRPEFYKNIKSKIAQGKLLSSTPKPFRGIKEFMYYDYLPPKQQQAIRERYGYSEEQMKEFADKEHYRIDEWTDNDNLLRDKETSFNEGYEADYMHEQDELYNDAYATENNGQRAEEYFGGYNERRLPADAGPLSGNKTNYRFSDDYYRILGDIDWENFGKNIRVKENPDAVPLRRDPFYRALQANLPVYSYGYERLRKLPPEKWNSLDKQLWNFVIGMAEGEGLRFVLKDIAPDTEVLADYPGLAMLPVEVSKELPQPIMYDVERNTVIINDRLYLNPQSKKHINAVLNEVISNYKARRKSVSRQINEFNVRFKDKYENAVTLAKKITKMHEIIPDFDADKRIAKSFKKEFGYTPDEFLANFPNIDDYLLDKITRKMGGLITQRHPSNYFRENAEEENGTINALRSFFWGPVEIIVNAVKKGSAKGPLRLATKRDRKDALLPPSKLDICEDRASYIEYSPEIYRYYKIPDPRKKKDPTGWEEYKRKKFPKYQKEMEEAEERERRERWLKMD